jgi:hypothetical protein
MIFWGFDLHYYAKGTKLTRIDSGNLKSQIVEFPALKVVTAQRKAEAAKKAQRKKVREKSV